MIEDVGEEVTSVNLVHTSQEQSIEVEMADAAGTHCVGLIVTFICYHNIRITSLINIIT